VVPTSLVKAAMKWLGLAQPQEFATRVVSWPSAQGAGAGADRPSELGE
jgi:hypothetical protein